MYTKRYFRQQLTICYYLKRDTYFMLKSSKFRQIYRISFKQRGIKITNFKHNYK